MRSREWRVRRARSDSALRTRPHRKARRRSSAGVGPAEGDANGGGLCGKPSARCGWVREGGCAKQSDRGRTPRAGEAQKRRPTARPEHRSPGDRDGCLAEQKRRTVDEGVVHPRQRPQSGGRSSRPGEVADGCEIAAHRGKRVSACPEACDLGNAVRRRSTRIGDNSTHTAAEEEQPWGGLAVV